MAPLPPWGVGSKGLGRWDARSARTVVVVVWVVLTIAILTVATGANVSRLAPRLPAGAARDVPVSLESALPPSATPAERAPGSIHPSAGPSLTILTGAGTTNSYVGTGVTGWGANFSAGVPIWVNWTGGEVCSNTTNSVGNFSCHWNTPYGPEGPHTFWANDTVGESATATFSIYSDLGDDFLNQTTAAGSWVNISGNGFGASVTVWANFSAGPACSSTSNASGSFSCLYQMSKVPVGTYTFKATDSEGHFAWAVSFGVVSSSLGVNPSSARVGASVTVSGVNWDPSFYATVVIVGGNTLCRTLVSTHGGLSCTAPVPELSPATYELKANDTYGDIAFTNLTVEAGVTQVIKTVSIAPLNPSVPTGGSKSFDASVACSPSPCPSSGVTYAWSVSGLGTISSTSGPSTVFTSDGTVGSATISVIASLNGTEVDNSTGFEVVASTPPSSSNSSGPASAGFLGLPGLDGYFIIGGIAIVVVGAAAVVLSRRKKTPPAP